MKLSILMVAYNHERFIAQAIESTLFQLTSFDFELIIGEDCSTDSTRKVIDQYARANPRKIRRIYRDKNVGMTQNFVETYNACRGEYVAILEGDDFWIDPLKLQIQVDSLEKHSEWAMCYHPVTVRFEDGDIHTKPATALRRPAVSRLRDIVLENPIDTCSVVFRNNLVAQFPKWLYKLRMCDWPLHVLNACHGDAGFIDRNMAAYRIHAGGVWSSSSNLQRIRGLIDAMDCFARFLGPSYWSSISAASAQLCGKAAHLHGTRGEYASSRRYLNRYLLQCGWLRTGYRSCLPKLMYNCYLRWPSAHSEQVGAPP